MKRQASATQLRMRVSFETVRSFQGLVIVESEFARQFPWDVAVVVVRQLLPQSPALVVFDHIDLHW